LILDIGSDFREWAYWHFLDVNNNNWPSWKAFYGPHRFNGDDFTTDMRYNVCFPHLFLLCQEPSAYMALAFE